MATAGRTINVNDLIDSRRLSWFQIGTFALCVLTGALDGFDSQAIAFVAPLISGDLGLDINSFGPIFAAGNIGGLIGALTLPVIADRIGRKSIIIVSVVMFALFTFANAGATSYQSLLILRFFTGLGIGSALPSVIALSTEYAPRSMRSFLVTVVTSGFPLGAMVAGGVTSALAPHWGWRGVFYIGAAAPLVLAVALILWLPESIRFLVGTDAPLPRIAGQIRRIARDLTIGDNDTFFLPEAKFKGLPMKHLFTEGRAGMTVLIWFVYFMNLTLLFFLYNWMPPVLQGAGLSLNQAVLTTAMFNLGGVIGGIALGLLADRIGAYRVLLGAYAVGAVLLGSVGFLGNIAPLITSTIFVAGFCCIGAQTTTNPLTASLYPTLMRSTGLGWAFGIARLGTILGPIAGGIMMMLGWGITPVFLAAIVPPLLAATGVLALKRFIIKAEADEAAAKSLTPVVAASPTVTVAPRAAATNAKLAGGAIMGLESVLFATDEVETSAAFFVDVGLDKRHASRSGASFSVPGEGTTINLLRTGDASLPVASESGEALRAITWGVSDRATLDAIGAELSRDREVKADAEGRLHTIGPDGLAISFQVSAATHLKAPLITPASSRINSRIAAYEKPKPSHLGHVGLFVRDIEASAAFYQRLGFRISDRITDFGLFLRGTGSIDHHNLFVIKRDKPGLNHLNLRLADVDELGVGMSYLERRGWRPVWGLGRHLFGSHMFGFFDNPAGSYLEFTCDEDYILDDAAWQLIEVDPRLRPITLWGGMLPPEVLAGEKPKRNL